MPELKDLTAEIIRFQDKRDRAQFHTPRNLAVAMTIAVNGVAHLFLAPL